MGHKIFFLLIFFPLFLFFPGRYLSAQVLLTEIMFDALGADTHDEFVEIFNLSDSVAVDLSGWQISDGKGIDSIVAISGGTLLLPRQFAVILDASYFSNSDTYNDLIPEASLILSLDNLTFGSGGLSNSIAETISLINSSGEIVSQYTYSLGNKPGFSDEKIDLAGPNTSENWSDSRVSLGTPGAPNSVSPLNVDLAIFENDIRFSSGKIQSGESVLITATVRNLGKNPVAEFSVSFFDDQDGDAILESDEQLGPALEFSGSLLANDSISFSIEWADFSAGAHLIFASAELASDEDQTNNIASRPWL
ncbi:MAG: lamin tail domain-containing protein, partial [bacterium]